MAIHSWISKQLTILAEAFGEQLTLERVEIYVTGLVDVPQERLKISFERALYELKWFPKLAELRDLSGTSADDEKKVEARAAWDYANEYLREWGVDRLPVRSGGQWITAPPLEPRLEYAIRQIGGFWRLNQVTDESYPFVFRDFSEAYALAPVAELMESRLLQQFSRRELEGCTRELSGVATAEQGREADRATDQSPPPTAEILPEERRNELRSKLREELAKRGIEPSLGGLQ